MFMLAPSRVRHISHTHWHVSQEIEPLRMKIRHLPTGWPMGRKGPQLTVYARLQLTIWGPSPHCLTILSGGT